MEQKKVIRLKQVSIYHGGDNLTAKRLISEGEMVLSEVDLSVARGCCWEYTLRNLKDGWKRDMPYPIM